SSGGAGQFRGGLGVSFEIGLLRGEAVSSVIGDRGLYPPFGVQGGEPGALATVRYTLSGRSYVPAHVTKDEGVAMQPGDTVSIQTPGGGGWGPAVTRDPASVVRDVSLGLITVADAARDYGVVAIEAGGTWQCDEAATRALRSSRHAPDIIQTGKPS